MIMPYNGSIFEIRQSYDLVFGNDDFKREKEKMNSLDISNIQGNLEELILGGSEN